MKVDNERLSLELKFKQENSTRHLDDIVAFTERVEKSDKVVAKEKSKSVIAER